MLSWLAVVVGVTAHSAEGASSLSALAIILPYLSSGFVPTETLPKVLKGDHTALLKLRLRTDRDTAESPETICRAPAYDAYDKHHAKCLLGKPVRWRNVPDSTCMVRRLDSRILRTVVHPVSKTAVQIKIVAKFIILYKKRGVL